MAGMQTLRAPAAAAAAAQRRSQPFRSTAALPPHAATARAPLPHAARLQPQHALLCGGLAARRHAACVPPQLLLCQRRPLLASRCRAVRVAASSKLAKRNAYNGVFLLILINVLLFVAVRTHSASVNRVASGRAIPCPLTHAPTRTAAFRSLTRPHARARRFAQDHVLHFPAVSGLLYLQHTRWHWWQLVTCAFCHGSWDHLSSNLFFLLVFGKQVEEEEGAFGVWASYILCGAGASIASLLLLPATSHGASVVSLGASGAVFGLFTISVLVKLSWDWRKLLESFILGSFVLEKVWPEIGVTTQGGGIGASGVNHVAHLAGALCGVLLILAVSRMFPPQKGADDGDDDDGDDYKRLTRG
jgi:membrane associated rhomboid family serine protease